MTETRQARVLSQPCFSDRIENKRPPSSSLYYLLTSVEVKESLIFPRKPSQRNLPLLSVSGERPSEYNSLSRFLCFSPKETRFCTTAAQPNAATTTPQKGDIQPITTPNRSPLPLINTQTPPRFLRGAHKQRR